MSRLWRGANLPDEVRELGEAARDFVERRVLPHETEIVATGVVPEPITKEVRELGYTGLVIAPEFGGLGVSYLGYCAILEQLSRAPKPVWLPVSVANGVAARMLEHSATAAQRERYLPAIASGELLPAIAVTEPEAGSDVQGMRSRARRVEGGWRIDGTKHYITHGARADVLFVLARTDDRADGRRRFTQFLVDKGTPGLVVARLQDTMAGGQAEQAELVFDGCLVGDEQVLGGEGQGLRCVLRTFAEERISMAITALGTAQRALELATDYARNRTAFGSTIGTYQAIQIALADSATELVAARAMTYGLAAELAHRPVERAEAAMVKLYASEMAGRVADRAVQVFGGFGYMAEAPVAQIYRDVRVMRISGGTSEIQRVIIAEALLEETQ